MQGLPLRLRECIEEQNLNATIVAEKAQLSIQVVTRLLRGERLDGVRLSTVIRMGRALGVRTAWLALGEPPKLHGEPLNERRTELAKAIAAEVAKEMKKGN